MAPQLTDNLLDSTSLGGPGNYPCPDGCAIGIFAAFLSEDIFINGTVPFNVGGCLLDRDFNLATMLTSTKLTATANVVEREKNWWGNFLQMDLIFRTDDMTHSYGNVPFVGDNSAYPFFTAFVGTRLSELVPSFIRTFTFFAGQTIADLKRIYPGDVIEIIERYGPPLGFLTDRTINSNGKLLLLSGAYNSHDLKIDQPVN